MGLAIHTGDKMGRGRDLMNSERELIHNKSMQNWDSELCQIKLGGRKIIMKACIKGGVRVCEEESFALTTTSALSCLMKVGFISRTMPLRLWS